MRYISFNDRSYGSLLSVENSGDALWEGMAFAFRYCFNMDFWADIGVPNLSNVRSMREASLRANRLTGTSLGDWDVSGVEDMRWLFPTAIRSISRWISGKWGRCR